ncbi:MAG: 5-methyltetrahydropteroyltriglutamate--homocysteine S-methyltransferase [Treponemataceae bacterium]|nr:5-methyltetrahydropteroyltriglutamate--homocysteine S-methyltransferase [Treponemataceae bacterium]
MKTTIVGFPRIGKNRELKTLLDAYFKGKCDADTLVMEAAHLEETQLRALASKLDIIPCNDFSFYDGMLDMVYLLGAIPRRFLKLQDNSKVTCEEGKKLSLYFAMARGSEVGGERLYPLEMKKWFVTNYHYLVPELSRDISWELNPSFLKAHVEMAQRLGHPFKVNLIGPLTFIYLSKIQEGSPEDYLEPVVQQYEILMSLLQEWNVPWVQMEEPVLATDLGAEEVEHFRFLYDRILAQKGSVRVVLQTYFGDIRDIWSPVCEASFDAIGLDFVTGPYNLELIQRDGFPQQKVLVAGCIDGRNIWKADLHRQEALIKKLSDAVSQEMWLSTSCSLLYVPYTVARETSLPENLRSSLAFAEEKIEELGTLKKVFEDNPHREWNKDKVPEDPKGSDIAPQRNDTELQHKEREISFTRTDFRSLPRQERYRLQQERLQLPLFPTTTIGSFPQDMELRRMRKQYREGIISLQAYEAYLRDRIRQVISLQEELGLDVLVHGEYERNDMVEYFAEHLEGFYTTDQGWVQSYGSRVTKPPIIHGNIRRTHPITVPWISYAQSLTKKPVKAILTGPITIINWSFIREDLPLETVASQLAHAIREEIDDLQEKGIPIIQVDEAALREKLPLRRSEWKDYLAIAVGAFQTATASVRPDVQLHTHMCYSEFGSMVEAINAFDVDVLTIEAARSQFELLPSFQTYAQEHQIGPGIYDIHSPLVPTIEELKRRILRMLEHIPASMLWINPDCGLKTRNMEETKAALEHMVEAAKSIREQYREGR